MIPRPAAIQPQPAVEGNGARTKEPPRGWILTEIWRSALVSLINEPIDLVVAFHFPYASYCANDTNYCDKDDRSDDRAYAAAEIASWKMARTKPSTAAGAAELLAYITTGPITGLFELGETS